MASVLLVLVASVVVSGYFAYTATEEARAARHAENQAKAREIAEAAARKDADAQKERAELAIAEALLDQGLTLCENQEVNRGLLTLVRALENVPPGAVEVQQAIHLNLAFWLGQVRVPHGSDHQGSSMTAAAFAPDGKTFLTGDWGNGCDRRFGQ